MNPRHFRLFLLKKMPIAYIAGLKLHFLNENQCAIQVKLSWWNQNPFHSMFWAVQGMAAELSSGVLCLDSIQKSGKPVSMLVISESAQFLKKAKGRIIFECLQGGEINDTIQQAIQSGEGHTIEIKSIGKDEAGDKVAEFAFVWSFKLKTQKNA